MPRGETARLQRKSAPAMHATSGQRNADIACELGRRDIETEALRSQVNDPAGARRLAIALQENTALRKENSVLRRELRLAHTLLVKNQRVSKGIMPEHAEVCILRRELKLMHRMLCLARGEDWQGGKQPAAALESAVPPSNDTVISPHISEPDLQPLAARADGLADGLAAMAQEAPMPMNDAGGTPTEPPIADEPAPRPTYAAVSRPPLPVVRAGARRAPRPAVTTPPQSITLAAGMPDKHNGRTFGKRKRGLVAELGDDDFASDWSGERTLKKERHERDQKMIAKGVQHAMKFVVKAFGHMHENMELEESSISAL